MHPTPPRLHTDAADIARINANIHALDDEATVRLTLADGTTLDGTVTARPTIETFRAADGHEGHNALLRLDDLEDPARSHLVWVDDIVDITRLLD
ncbi:DUF3247 family protein [Luteimonas sp. BDR2-5]|uniref:DUF3247 family protein n=1 Tax=Proluteimonas luteida TaxID=2878685 RepID=UPI001E32DC2E|nr:DUF3247 family protein [Luteimonas sp. BDR2-5]MCD9026675.1 DUF3247 family protein [Luteimonas sp. BDR2-5]